MMFLNRIKSCIHVHGPHCVMCFQIETGLNGILPNHARPKQTTDKVLLMFEIFAVYIISKDIRGIVMGAISNSILNNSLRSYKFIFVLSKP